MKRAKENDLEIQRARLAAVAEEVRDLLEKLPNSSPAILDEAGACKLLVSNPRQLRLWRATRGLPHYKVTEREIRYKRVELIAWMERERVAHAA